MLFTSSPAQGAGALSIDVRASHIRACVLRGALVHRRHPTEQRRFPMLLSRHEELILIDSYIAEHGCTMCPERFAVRLDALSAAEMTRRLAAFTPRARPPTKEEAERRWRRLLHLAETAPDIDRSYQLWLTRLPIRLGR
jgi:hypothetical protein